VTVNVKFLRAGLGLPSVRETSSIESDGAESSSLIVPSPWPSAIVALIAFERLTK